jgi:hypothetical protein
VERPTIIKGIPVLPTTTALVNKDLIDYLLFSIKKEKQLLLFSGLTAIFSGILIDE